MNETSHGVLPIARDCDSCCEVGFCCEDTCTVCVPASQLLRQAHLAQHVSQPEAQPDVPGLESSPSPAAHSRDLPEHRSNSARGGAGRSAQVPARARTARKGQTAVWNTGKYISRVSPIWGQFCFRPSPQTELGPCAKPETQSDLPTDSG